MDGKHAVCSLWQAACTLSVVNCGQHSQLLYSKHVTDVYANKQVSTRQNM